MKTTVGTVRRLIRETLEDADDNYEDEKRSMVEVPAQQYRQIYSQLRDELKPFETFTNVGSGERDPDHHVYTLWGTKAGGIDTPVISSRNRGGEWTYMANPKFLQT